MLKKGTNFILALDRNTRMQELNEFITTSKKRDINSITINVKPSRTYSNVCAPIAGLIEYYRELGISIQVKYPKGDYVRHTRFWAPIAIEECAEAEKFYPLDKVWTFQTSEGVSALVSAYILELRKTELIEEGVIESIEWCLNEVMDNVLQHAGTGKGYVMAQIHKQAKTFAFCVFDSGVGIYNSLKSTKHHPEKPIDAITLALQERITRDEKIGQGNGLWGLSSIISESNGQMEVSSGGAKYRVLNGNIITKKEGGFILSSEKGTAYLDIRLDYNKKINITKALGGYTPSDIWLENLMGDDESYILKVAEIASGTGTRQSAIKLRNIAMNISNIEKKVVVFDFEGINLISSSFADELIGKIIAEKGLMYFLSAYKMKNLTPMNISIMNRSIEQRMAQKYYVDLFDDYDIEIEEDIG